MVKWHPLDHFIEIASHPIQFSDDPGVYHRFTLDLNHNRQSLLPIKKIKNVEHFWKVEFKVIKLHRIRAEKTETGGVND